MYGIVGFTKFYHSQIDKSKVIQKMMALLCHRSSYEGSIYIDDKVILGHNLSNIIESKNGRRPVHNEDKNIWLVLNGEIYNHRELHQKLVKLGHSFYTDTDAEIIVHLYEEYGNDCVNELNGMFAFAIWDKGRERLLLVRDRMGIKPLYYVQIGGELIFASEMKSILQYPDVNRRIDYYSLQRYLLYEYIPAPFTIFKDIRKLLPAHMLQFQNGKSALSKYWHINFIPKLKKAKEGEYIEQFKQLLKDAVRRRSISDVPPGVFLSGGIDSSTIAAFASGFLPGKIKSFSIAFERPSFDESRYAQLASSHFNTKHNMRVLRPKDLLEIIPKVIDCLNEPLGDASIIPTYLLSKFAKEQVSVVLGGDGADELFAGYDTYKAHKLAEFYKKTPLFIQRSINSIVNRFPVSTDNFSFDFKLKKFISGIAFKTALRHIVWMGSFAPQELPILLKGNMKADLNLDEDINFHLRGCDADNPFEQIQYLDMRLYLQEGGLAKLNRAGVASSLEIRAPFLDHTVIEFATKLPVHFKLHGFTSKYLLKKCMQDKLPKQILRRPKKGFGMPIAKWFQSELKGVLLDYLNKDHINKEGIFNYDYIKLLIDEHLSRRKDNRKLLWTLLIFELWHEKFLH